MDIEFSANIRDKCLNERHAINGMFTFYHEGKLTIILCKQIDTNLFELSILANHKNCGNIFDICKKHDLILNRNIQIFKYVESQDIYHGVCDFILAFTKIKERLKQKRAENGE